MYNSAMASTTRIADAPAQNWVDRLLPEGLKPYARLSRLDRPIGWWLLLLPCWWSLTLAQITSGGGLPDLRYAFLFLAGAIVMRGAGCTLNDIVDRNLDARVERTRGRPIPSGAVDVPAAVVYLVLQSLVGLVILLQFNRVTIVTGAASLLIVAVYPFMKRLTYWPQIVLGLAFNWGALVGWAAVQGSLGPAAFALYAGGLFWTLAYDTIYAHQDREDDVLIGVKSTALKLGETSPAWIAGFFAAALLLLDAAVWLAGGGILSHIGIAAALVHAAWQVRRLDIDDPVRCLSLFRSNRDFGLIIAAGFLLDSLIR
jgi:4-hydroxybenzoate polyprenyltransferase